MTRANRKKKLTGRPLKYKSTEVNYQAVDFAIEVQGKYYYLKKRIYKDQIDKYRSLFLSFLRDRKQRKEEFSHQDVVWHCLNIMN